jgi:hypothetical protein
MRDIELYRRILGLTAPWTVASVDLDVKGQRVVVRVEGIVAERRLELRRNGRRNSVTVRLRRPQRDPLPGGDRICVVEVDGIPGRRRLVRASYDVDAVQALLLAFQLIRLELTAEPQPAEKVYRIGMLETRSTVLNAANIDAFRQGLQERGYKEGHNLEIVYRPSDGRDGRFPGLASELVSLKADLILTRGMPGAPAAKSATRTIPVVITIRCSGPAAPAAERRRSPAELGVADRDRRAYSVGT